MMKARPQKQHCSICSAYNRRVKMVVFLKKPQLLCEECAEIAKKIAKKQDEIDAKKKAAFTEPFIKNSQVRDSVRDILKATRPTIPQRPLTHARL